MDAKMRKYGVQSSPERLKAAPKQSCTSRKIPVVYYLCRNHHLEHPHFIEVPISSPEGLHLRDVIWRLIELRGKGMPVMYSWSCKRSYKNGFVWHDLSEDDLILPVHGNEYVLKGSELLDQSPPDRTHHAATNSKPQNLKAPQTQETPTSSKTHEACSSSSPINVIKESKTPPSLPQPLHNQEDEQSPRVSPSYDSSSPGTSEFRVYKPTNATNASTQTDENGKNKINGEKAHSTVTRGVSTDDSSPDSELKEISPPPMSLSSSGGKMETLESLIRADARKMNNLRVVHEEEVYASTGPRMRATNVLMQLITCGSLSVKDRHNFGLVPAYKQRFSHMNFPSPMFDLDRENPKMAGLRIEDKEYFSGSFIETKKHKEEVGEGVATLKRSNSFNADRSMKSPDLKPDKDKVADSLRSKCLPRTIKISTPNKQYKNGMMRSPISDCPRISSAGPDSGHLSSQAGSNRMSDNSSLKGTSMRLESFNEEKEKVVKIEERLTSGARVIIQLRASGDESEGSSSS